jgi:ribonuclease VapC
MAKNVIDSSAIIAILRKEGGKERAFELSFSGEISSVIYTEILMKCAMKNVPFEAACELLDNLQIEIQQLTASTAKNAGALKLNKQFWSLSLADCICITMAIENSATLVTADRAWLDLDLPCQIELIR